MIPTRPTSNARRGHAATTLGLACLVVALVAALASDAAAAVRGQVDRHEIPLDRPLTLSLEARGSALSAEPDLAALDADFQVLAVSRGYRTTLLNGRRDDTAEWQITLLPRAPGNKTVPAIHFGSEVTDPIPVTVLAAASRPAPQGASTAPAPSDRPASVSFTARVDETDPYVQQQVVLTLRLESSVPISQGSIGDPVVPGALVERLGEDAQGSDEVDGVPIQWVERRYAIFPQQSGRLDIGAVTFEGVVPSERRAEPRRRAGAGSRFGGGLGSSLLDDPFFDDPFFDDFLSGFGGLGGGSLFDRAFGPRGRRIATQSDPIALDVRPRADGSDVGRWLPVRDLELIEVWGEGQAEPPVLRVGEPVDRAIAVRARGVSATQLPAPTLGEPDGFKQYEEPAQQQEQEAGGEMLAVRLQPTVLIPTREGELELPPIELAWWDTEAEVARTALLPARTVHVLPARQPDPELAGAGPGDPETGGDGPVAENASVVAPSLHATARDLTDRFGITVAQALVCLGLIVGALWLARRDRGSAGDTGRSGDPADRRTRTRLEAELRGACRRGDATAAEAALLGLARIAHPGAAPSARAFALALGDADFEREVVLLLSSRYAADGAKWSGDGLWAAYRRARQRAPRRGRDAAPAPLPDLYPSSLQRHPSSLQRHPSSPQRHPSAPFRVGEPHPAE